MNNIDEFKEYVDENMKDIKMTDEIRKNILRKSTKNRIYNFKYAAIIILPMFFMTFIFFSEQIGYATQNILRYVPGMNILVEDTNHKQYGLLGSVKLQIDEKEYIKINCAYSKNNSVILNIESNLAKYEKIKAIDKDGKMIVSNSMDVIRDLDTLKWSGRFTFDFDKFSNEFDIVYDNYKLPVIMSELPEVLVEERNYISIENINLDIAVITNYVNDKLQINLLTKSNSEDQSVSFPMKDIYLLDSNGKKYYSSSNNFENILYFDRKLENNIKLVIPYILVEDDSIEANMTISKDDKTPINIGFGEYSLKINEMKWSKQSKSFKFKTEDKKYISTDEQESQELELMIDKNLIGTDKLSLQDVCLDVSSGKLIKHENEGVKMLFSDSIEQNNSTKDTVIKKVISDIKTDANKINIKFDDFVFRTENEVIIPLQP